MVIELLMVGLLQQGPNDVFEVHDKFPQRHGRVVKQADDECHEQHHLQPDGDHDCDDPGFKVDEPGSLPLAVLGLAGLGWVWLRRRGG